MPRCVTYGPEKIACPRPGCRRRICPNGMRGHLRVHDLMMRTCPVPNCSFKGRGRELRTHLKRKQHGECLVQCGMCSARMYPGRLPRHEYEHHGIGSPSPTKEEFSPTEVEFPGGLKGLVTPMAMEFAGLDVSADAGVKVEEGGGEEVVIKKEVVEPEEPRIKEEPVDEPLIWRNLRAQNEWAVEQNASVYVAEPVKEEKTEEAEPRMGAAATSGAESQPLVPAGPCVRPVWSFYDRLPPRVK